MNVWCDDCRPRSLENYEERVFVVQNYLSALYLEITLPKEYFESLSPLLALANAKGLDNSLEDADLEAFFHGRTARFLRARSQY